MPPKIDHCTACGTAIIFAAHLTTGNPAPLEAAPAPEGTWLLTEDLFGQPTYRHVRPDARADYAGRLHVNHFGRCPHAAQFSTPKEPRT